MARTPFQVEVLTPEGEAFNDEVEMVSTRTSVGSIGILANHQPLLGMLDPTELRLYKGESDVVRYAQGEGFLQVYGNRVLLLVDEIFEIDELSDEDRLTVQRARRIERFLSQPFHVAEAFTGTPGQYVPIQETVRSFKEILEGEHDDLPERAFLLKGTIEDVVEEAKGSGGKKSESSSDTSDSSAEGADDNESASDSGDDES